MAADIPRIGSRTAILRLLCASPRTTGDFAACLGISRNAVRKALAQLAAEGLVEFVAVARGVGKPAYEFKITPAGEATISRAYMPMLRALVQELSTSLSTERLERILRRSALRVAPPPAPASTPLHKRLAAATTALNDLGGAAAVSGSVIVCQCCAISAVVTEQPLACKAMESFVSRVAGAAAREKCDRTGRPRCRFEFADQARDRKGTTGAGRAQRAAEPREAAPSRMSRRRRGR